MITPRRIFLLALLLGCVTGSAFGQVIVGTVGSGSAGPFTCLANIANPTVARSTGYAEPIGDIVIACTGGTNLTLGSTVPTTNITVTLSNTIVTSRVFGNGLSEASLLIDEPGSNGIIGGPTGAGTLLTQTLCSGGALGAGAGGCETYANRSPGVSRASTCMAFTDGLCTSFGATPNVFQGVVSNNQVVFNGVPMLAPVTSGYARVFRIANVRVNAAQFWPITGNPPIQASITSSSLVTIANSIQTGAFVFDALQSATVQNATNTAAGSSIGVLQCASGGLQAGAVLRFSEGWWNAWRTRVTPGGGLSGAGTPDASVVTATNFSQNIPWPINNGSESRWVFPVTGGTAGLADFGTRLKATFLNVPAGVNIYVSTTNINPLGNTGANPTAGNDLTILDTAVASGNFAATSAIKLLAGLVTSETAVAAPGEALPLRAATNTANNVRLFGPLPVDANGTATAVWEMLLTDPSQYENAEFAVYYTQNGTPPLSPAGTVALSMAPTYASVDGGTLIPRWSPPTTATNLINVISCESLTSSRNPSTYGQPVTFTYTVGGAGTATFRDGLTSIGTATISGGQAVLTTAALGAGTHSITAAPDGLLQIISNTVTQVVNKASTATSLNVGSGSANAGQTALFTATVTASGGTPGGTVTFRNGGTAIGTAFLDGGGTARMNLALPIGAHSISAVYSGDANFNGSTSSAQGFSVNSLSTSVSTPVLRSGTPAPGASLTFAATVSGDGPPLTGMVTFQDGSRTLGSAAMDGSGTATITTTLGAGTHTITASYSGDVSRSGSTSAALVLTIKAAPSVTLTSSPNPADAGAAITLTATLTGVTGLPAPAGAVTFREGAATLGSGTLDGSGKATLTLAGGLPAGDHSITAAYGGDPNYDAGSATVTQRVSKPASGTTLTQGSANNGVYVTALVGTAVTGTPTGSVEFRDVTGGAGLGSAALANGRATITVPASVVGHSVQATYSGDSQFAGSTSPSLTVIGAVNGFSFGTDFSLEGLVSLFGAGLAGETASAAGMPLPTTLGGTSVWIVDSAGRPYPVGLYYVSPGQINFVVPMVPVGPALIRIATQAGEFGIEVTIRPTAPALASANGSGSGPAAAQVIRVHRDGTQEAPVSTPVAWADGDRLFLVLYGTGLRHMASPVSCTLNGTPAAMQFVGAQGVYPGLDQVNLEIPAGMRGTIAARCSVAGMTSNTVTVSVE